MQLGLVGLGKMGGNMRERIRRAGHEVVGYDRNQSVSDARSLADMVKKLDAPRVVWVMVPHGAPTRDTVVKLAGLLDKGDLVIDGGNSKFTDDFENEKLLKAKGIGYLDCGVSGGIWGLDNGYGLMVGGSAANVRKAMPIFDALRPEGPRDEGFVHAGKVGAGHYTKMVHNGIEYGLMAGLRRGLRAARRRRTSSRTCPGPSRRGAAARSCGPGCSTSWSRRSRRTPRSTTSPTTPPTPARAGGPSRRRSTSRCRCRSSRPRCSPASPPASRARRRMQAVAALRGQFGGHEVMSIAEGDQLRAEAAAGPASAAAATAKASRKETPPKSSKAAAAKGRKAASAGPSSGAGATSSSRRGGAASAGPTSGTSSTRKRAAKKS